MLIDQHKIADFALVEHWCSSQGVDWKVIDTIETVRSGGTATVYRIDSPQGLLALKLYSEEFSFGDRGRESLIRLKPQIDLGLHDCPFLVRVHDGGRLEDQRLFVLMDAANGRELEECLAEIPRDKIRNIVDQIARAVIFLRQNGQCHRDIKSANIFISDDYDSAILLDLSVLRDVDDPLGSGTDHGHELPVVATSRYSPPEYLFRLVPPSADLWHALDVYQLGGLLHDLIMREPMFAEEYQKTRETNRYRFAWIVATQEPKVHAADVDPDLVSLARRALDKDWQRRGNLRLEDFLDEAEVHRSQALLALGANVRPVSAAVTLSAINERMRDLSVELEGEVVAGLRSIFITAKHIIEGTEGDRILTFSWEPVSSPEVQWRNVNFSIILSRVEKPIGPVIEISVKLEAVGDTVKQANIGLPEVNDDQNAAPVLATAAMGALADLAIQVLRNEGN